MMNEEVFLKYYKNALFYIVSVMLSAIYAAEIVFAFRIYPAYSFGNILKTEKIENMLQINIIPIILLSAVFWFLSQNINKRSSLSFYFLSAVSAFAAYLLYTISPDKYSSVAQYQASVVILSTVPFSLIETIKKLIPEKTKRLPRILKAIILVFYSVLFVIYLYIIIRYTLLRAVYSVIVTPVILILITLLINLELRKPTKVSLLFIMFSFFIFAVFNFYSDIFTVISNIIFITGFVIFAICIPHELKKLLKLKN